MNEINSKLYLWYLNQMKIINEIYIKLKIISKKHILN
jgi:hypothetical protein